MNKSVRIALIVGVLSVPLSASTCMYGITHPGESKAQLYAEKALIVAHDLHDVLALSASAAANSNACVSTCAVQVKDYLDRSEALLVEADKVTDADTIFAKIEAAKNLIDQGKAIIAGARTGGAIQ